MSVKAFQPHCRCRSAPRMLQTSAGPFVCYLLVFCCHGDSAINRRAYSGSESLPLNDPFVQKPTDAKHMFWLSLLTRLL